MLAASAHWFFVFAAHVLCTKEDEAKEEKGSLTTTHMHGRYIAFIKSTNLNGPWSHAGYWD